MNRYSPIAAVFIFLAVLIATLLPSSSRPTYASDVIMVPDGGRLDAMDTQGRVRGACPLKHTDVNVAVTGHFTRVTLTQKFQNPYTDKIEAVYTFPLSERAAVDRMTMTIGDRVVLGEVHERAQARAMYEAARASGHIASLLEQERPNIFTQSVANIDPGAEIDVTISYVELLDSKDGTYSLAFPMVVGPRYVPGSQRTGTGELPAGYQHRRGVALLGPAKLTIGQPGDVSQRGTLQDGKLAALLHDAVAIEIPIPASSAPAAPLLWYHFEATYCDGSKDLGVIYTNGTGHVNGRWFYADLEKVKNTGAGFSPDTTQVPDASRITPQPVRPGKRAGHDISLSVTIDTGGPAIRELKSALHEMIEDRPSPSRARLQLRNEREIPNRDFVLTWKDNSDKIQEATFTHTGEHGNFFTLILQPPERVTDVQAVPRELVFVLDTSGSMSGFPIEKAKGVMSKAIAALRPQDTFNLITFSGDTHILWDRPRPATADNIAAYQQFLVSRQGSGGTEMMKAINAALTQRTAETARILTLDELANLPADGREVIVRTQERQMTPVFQDGMAPSVVDLALSDGQKLRARIASWMLSSGGFDPTSGHGVEIKGRWVTEDHQRLFAVREAVSDNKPDVVTPVRICCFMTDGFVGNDMQIIDAIKNSAKTTRVFSFGIGNSVNRYLLDGMARAGRGEVEYVLLGSDADAAVKRFAQRIQTPVLTHIELRFSDNLKVVDLVPAQLPDLFDVKPLILHGRYTTPGRGTLTIRGNTGSGRYERTLQLDLPAREPQHDTIATLWARAKVDDLLNQNLAAAQQGTFPPDLRRQVVNLGEQFQIMTQFTSFVAIEKARVTIAGQPRLVAVPIEMPQGVSYEGIFGGDVSADIDDALTTWDFGKGGTGGRSGTDHDHISPQAGAKPSRRSSGSSGSVYRMRRDAPATSTAARPNPVEWYAPAAVIRTQIFQAPASVGGYLSGSYRGFSGGGAGYGGYGGGTAKSWAGANTAYTLELGESDARKPANTDKRGQPVLSSSFDSFNGVDAAKLEPGLANRLVGGPQPDHDSDGEIDGDVYAYPRRVISGFHPFVSEKDRIVHQKLSTEIPQVALPQGTRFEEAIASLQKQGNCSIDVNWDALAQVGVNRDSMLNLDLHSLKLETALTIALENVGAAAGVQLTHDVVDGRIRISTLEELYRPVAHLLGQSTIPFLRERIAIRIAKLFKENRLADAFKLTAELVVGAPDFKIGLQMRAVLADAKLTPVERDQRIAALADEARKPIDAAIRQVELRRRLDERLYRFAMTPATQPAPEGLALTSDAVRVTALLADVAPATLTALKDAGFQQEAVAPLSRLVVGQAPRGKLAGIAMVEAVRRIEPTITASPTGEE